MDMFLFLLGFFVALFGLVNVVYPIKRLGIATRGKGALVFLAGFVMFFAGAMIGGASPPTDSTDKQETAATSAADSKAGTTSSSTTQTASETEQPKELTLEEYLQQMIVEEAGAQSNLPDRPARIVKDGLLLGRADIGTYATISLWADDNLTNDLIRTGILRDSTNIFKRLFTERQDAPDRVILQWYFPLEDVKGNRIDLPIVTVTMTKANAATFNWDNFRYSNLPKAADKYVEHQALSK